MKALRIIILLLLCGLSACALREKSPDSPSSETLAPTRILANEVTLPAMTEIALRPEAATAAATEEAQPSPSPSMTSPAASATPGDESATPHAAETSTSAPGSSPAPTTTSTSPATEEALPGSEEAPAPLATSNNAALRLQQDSGTLVLSIEMGEDCFLAEEFVPFRFVVRSATQEPFYFYKNGQWLISINNSALGPELAPLEPNAREDFIELAPNAIYVKNEEDLGFWTLSLGPDSPVAMTSTGVGLPPGDYWMTAAYRNYQTGLNEQRDGTFLIPTAAWQGTVVSAETRFTIVSDLSEC